MAAPPPPPFRLLRRRLIEINYEDVHRAASYRTHLCLLITCSDFNYTTTLACFYHADQLVCFYIAIEQVYGQINRNYSTKITHCKGEL